MDPIGSNQIRSGPIRSDQVRSDPIRSDQIRSGPIRSDQVRLSDRFSWAVDLRQLGVKLYEQVTVDGNGLTGKDVLIKLIDSLLSKDFCCAPWLVKGQRSIFKLLSHFLLRESTGL